MYISLSTKITRQGNVKNYPNIIEDIDSGAHSSIIGTAKIGNIKIKVASSELDDTAPQLDFIIVNGAVVANNVGRGHTLAIINPNTGATVSVTTYDTYGAGNSNALNSALLGMTEGYIAAICSYDATTLSASTRTTLNYYFQAPLSNTWNAGRVAHYFVGQKNTPWILTSGYWDDNKIWKDNKTWKDN
jgi:hypothetical protein